MKERKLPSDPQAPGIRDLTPSLGALLRDLRTSRNLTQGKLQVFGRRAGLVGAMAVPHYEQDRRTPPPAYVRGLLKLLDATLEVSEQIIRVAAVRHPRRYGPGLQVFSEAGLEGWHAWAESEQHRGRA